MSILSKVKKKDVIIQDNEDGILYYFRVEDSIMYRYISKDSEHYKMLPRLYGRPLHLTPFVPKSEKEIEILNRFMIQQVNGKTKNKLEKSYNLLRSSSNEYKAEPNNERNLNSFFLF